MSESVVAGNLVLDLTVDSSNLSAEIRRHVQNIPAVQVKVDVDAGSAAQTSRKVKESLQDTQQAATAMQQQLNSLFQGLGSEATGAARKSADAFKQAARDEAETARAGQQRLRDQVATQQLNARLAAQARQEQAAAERAAAQAARQAQREAAQAARETQAAEQQAQREGMQRLRDRAATVQLTARLQRDAERQAQEAINGTIRALDNLQKGQRDAWKTGKLVGVDLVDIQRDVQRRALEAAAAVDKESEAHRRLMRVAGAAQDTMDRANGKITPGSLSHSMVLGIQQSGLFAQISALGGPAAQNLGIVAQGFATARTNALQFAGATNTAATAAGFMTGGAAALAVGLGAAATGFIKLGQIGLDETKILERGLNTLTASGVQDLEGFQAQVRDLKTELGTVGKSLSTAELTASAAELVKANLSAADSLLVLAPAAKLAAAESTNLNEASAQLLMNTRQYGYGVERVAEVADMFAKAGNLAAGTANDLSLGFGKVGGTGKEAGIEMYDLLGMLIELDLKGMAAADVGADALRTALSSLADPSEKAQGILKELNIALVDNQGKARPAGAILADLGVKMRGMGTEVNAVTGALIPSGEALRMVSGLMDTRAAAAVINLTGEWKQHGQAVKDSSGYLDEYADIMSNGVGPAQQRLNTAIKDAGLAFTKSFAGPLANFLDTKAVPFMEWLGGVFDKMDKLSKMQDISLKFKLEPGDDTTMQVLKFIGGTIEGTKAVVNFGLDKLGFMENIKKLQAWQLQQELQNRNLIETPAAGDIGGLMEQYRGISANMAKYQQLLADSLKASAKSVDGLKNSLNQGNPFAPPKSGANLGVGLGSGDTIKKMDPAFQQALGQVLMQYIAQNAGGLVPYIHEGFRSEQRQAELYAQGRTAPGKIVTNAKPGQSIHNYGKAADIYWKDPVTGKTLSFDDPRALAAARALGQMAVQNGMIWGGTPGWGGPVDLPHIQVNQSWQEAARGAGVNTPSTAAKFKPASDQALIAEARRILTSLEGYKKDGNLTMQTQAEGILKAFTDSGPRAAAAVDYVRSQVKAATTEVSKFGQGYDKLKAQLEQSGSLYKINDDAGKYIQSLDGIAAAAQKAAAAEFAKNKDTEKYRALLALAGDATAKARQERESLARTEKQAADDVKRRAEEKKRLDQELAGAQLDKAQATAARLKIIDDRTLANFKGTAEERLDLVKKLSQEEFERADKLAAAERNRAYRDAAGKPNEAALKAAAQEKYLLAVETARNTRLEAMQRAQEGVTQAQNDYNRALQQGIEDGNAALANLDQLMAGSSEAAQALATSVKPSSEVMQELLTRIESLSEDLTSTPGTAEAWIESIQAMGAAGQLTAKDVQFLIDRIKELNDLPEAEWAQDRQDAGESGTARYGGTQGEAATDWAMRMSYGLGLEGYNAALQGYGVRSIDELEKLNATAAASMRRVYSDVLDEMAAEQQAGAERAVAILDNARADLEAAGDQVAQDAEVATEDLVAATRRRIDGLKDAGPFGILNFLGGTQSFGERFWDLGEDGRAYFMEAFSQIDPDDMGRLGVNFLTGLRDRIDPNDPTFKDIRARLDQGIASAQAKGNTTAADADLSAITKQFLGLDSSSADYASTLDNDLIPALENLKARTTDKEMQASIQATIDLFKAEAQAARQLADVLGARELADLEGKRATGQISEGTYIQDRVTIQTRLENEAWDRQKATLTAGTAEYRLAFAQHEDRLTEIKRKGIEDRQALDDRTADRQLALARNAVADGGGNAARTSLATALQSEINTLKSEVSGLDQMNPDVIAKLDRIRQLTDELKDVRLSVTLEIDGFDTGMSYFEMFKTAATTWATALDTTFQKVAQGSMTVGDAVGVAFADMAVSIVDSVQKSIIAIEAQIVAEQLLLLVKGIASFNPAALAAAIGTMAVTGIAGGLLKGALNPGSPTIQDPSGKTTSGSGSYASSAPAITYRLEMTNNWSITEGLDSPGTRQKLIAMQEQAALQVMDRAGLVKLPAALPTT